jgi:hypothetical protein
LGYKPLNIYIFVPINEVPIPPALGYIQADPRARFSHTSTFTPIIKSHKANITSPQNVNILIVISRSGIRKKVTNSNRYPNPAMINKMPRILGRKPDLKTK